MRLRCGGGRRWHRFGVPQWRNPHVIAGDHALVRFGALLVDADLTLAQQTEDVGARYVLEVSREKIVESLPRIVFSDRDVLHPRAGARFRSFWLRSRRNFVSH